MTGSLKLMKLREKLLDIPRSDQNYGPIKSIIQYIQYTEQKVATEVSISILNFSQQVGVGT